MNFDCSDSNVARIHLYKGETFYFPLKFNRGAKFGFSLVPPCPLGSPIARLWYRRYWMAKSTADSQPESLMLNGPSVIARFFHYSVEGGQSAFVNGKYLAGFSLGSAGHFKTILNGIFTPALWAFGHPLPMIAHGPCDLLFYGEGLAWEDVGFKDTLRPHQVATFDASSCFSVLPFQTGTFLAMLINLFSYETRIRFTKQTDVLAAAKMEEFGFDLHILLRLIIHLSVLLVGFFLIRSHLFK